MSGLTVAGFVRAVAAEIKEDLEDRFRAVFGSAIRTDPRSVFGQVIGVLTGAYDELWQLIETVYHAFDPRVATGASLDAVSAITGTSRKPATFSTGAVTLTGTATTVVPAGSLVQNADASYVYETDNDSDPFAAATAWSASASVAAGAYRSASGGIYYALEGGTTGSSEPDSTEAYPTTTTDGTVEWVFIGEGTAYVADVAITATSTGVVAGPAYSLSAIGSPVSGWSGVANIEDVSLGRAIEADSDLRVRRVAELHGLSRGTVDSIRAALLARTDVTSASVYQNTENETNGDGMPAHSVEAVVTGPIADTDVATILLANVPAGIKTHGNTTTSATDSHGTNHVIKYTVPDDVDCYIAVNVAARRSLWPSDGVDQVKDLVLAYGDGLEVGFDVEPSAIVGAVMGNPLSPNVAGLLSVSVALDTSADPVATDPIEIDQRHIADLDSARITVTVTYRTP